MKNIIFLAPPAAGKGTCSEILKSTYDYEHISTGAILRSEIDSSSSLGLEIKSVIDSGNLVSDELMINLIEERLSNNQKKFILDGFPRTLNQAEKLNELFNKLDISNYVVIYLNIEYDLALKRTLGRITCDKCGRSYNTFFEGYKPKVDGICDNCNTPLKKRGDDNEVSFKNRFETYLKNTYPILDYYKKIGKVREISIDNNVDLFSALKEIVSD